MSADTPYEPRPIETAGIAFSPELLDLTERLAENAHDVWAARRLKDGWRYGPNRDDARKTHPGLVPYLQLTEGEKEYDRLTALHTLRAIIALGYRIEKA
jgi:ryanodine receptor 2